VFRAGLGSLGEVLPASVKAKMTNP